MGESALETPILKMLTNPSACFYSAKHSDVNYFANMHLGVGNIYMTITVIGILGVGYIIIQKVM